MPSWQNLTEFEHVWLIFISHGREFSTDQPVRRVGKVRPDKVSWISAMMAGMDIGCLGGWGLGDDSMRAMKEWRRAMFALSDVTITTITYYNHISSHLITSLSLWQAVWSLGYLVSAIGDGVLCGACGLPAAHLPLNFSEGHGQFCRSCVQSLLQDEGM